jgi:galactoside O-acetyltransferase
LSGKVEIGNYVHIASSCLLYGGNAGIVFEDFSGVSPRVTIICDSEDYSGKHLTNPTIPAKYLGCIEESVVLKKHTIVGTGATILPGVILGEGCSIGAMSLVVKSIEPWTINVGIPARAIKERKKDLLDLEKQLLHGESEV